MKGKWSLNAVSHFFNENTYLAWRFVGSGGVKQVFLVDLNPMILGCGDFVEDFGGYALCAIVVFEYPSTVADDLPSAFA